MMDEEKEVRVFAKEWMNAFLSSLNRVDENVAREILRKPAEKCSTKWYTLEKTAEYGYDLQSHDLDSYCSAYKKRLEALGMGGGIRREGDVLYVDLKLDGKCGCPLVMNKIIGLTPSLCLCAINHFEYILSNVINKPVSVELIESIATGSKDCTFRAKFAVK